MFSSGEIYQPKNNIIKITLNGKKEYQSGENEYIYEYDDAGYPIKCTLYEDGDKTGEGVYKYKIASPLINNSKK